MPEDFYYYYLFILFLNRPHRVVLEVYMTIQQLHMHSDSGL